MRVYLFTLILSVLFSCEQENLIKHKTYWDNAQTKIQMEFFTKDDLRHGETINYYRNGVVKNSAIYKEGKLFNVNYVQNPKGKKMNFGNFKNGNGVLIFFNNEGKILSKGLYRNGYRDGKWIEYNFQGKINNYWNYNNGYLELNGIKTYDNFYN